MKKRTYIAAFFFSAVLAVLLIFMKLPYYVTMPGSAQKLTPLVHVEHGDRDAGAFMLTTVRMGRANVIAYLLAHIRPFYELHPVEEIKQEGESDKEYTMRQLELMEQSKEAAIVVAYRHAGKPVSYEPKGVYVVNVLPDMPAEGCLQAGDRLAALDGRPLTTSEQIIDYIRMKKEGDRVRIAFVREGERREVELRLKPFPHHPNQIGLGVTLMTDYDVRTDPPVDVDSEQIGGPSAGLMFSLEIYNQLVEEDMTKGHNIAGTGTIDIHGQVGPIGGVSQKVVAADRAGAEVFFAPNEHGSPSSNYREAVQTAKKIGTNMKIVPVDTFEDAIRYLRSMPEA
ncbi:SepM family pheromone-processing serine protease [Geobacillus stearothermophilus]|uniref:SepM family pheromone-processing serine protease n=1 Tax=Geobacillus stearothermophilus TaxID=1422 RepID=UPI002E2508E5|nr:SepM family pheromone-processing serine protease [Geobacillus stearothermophilus]MED4355578.1 SepM family pheromone-processing serine protease [Geobacillus stearothermophilus]